MLAQFASPEVCSKPLDRGSVVLSKFTSKWPVTAIAIFVFGLIIALRGLGLFQQIELSVTDQATVIRAATDRSPNVTVVLITDDDIVNRGWPLSDGVLAEALERIAAYDPVSIGVDIYRDFPVGEGQAKLDELLERDERINWVSKFPDVLGVGVEPPAVLAQTTRRGFADIVIDDDGVVRRALLFLDDGERFETSLAIAMTAPFLAAQGFDITGSDKDPDVLAIGQIALPPIESNEGPYVGAEAAGYQIPLDYARGESAVAKVSLSEVWEGTAPRELLEDRFVLLGVGAATVKDAFLTPVAKGGATFGVVLHGMIVDQILRHGLENAPRQSALSPIADHLWLLLTALVGAALGATAQSPIRLTLGFFALISAELAVAAAAFAALLWPPIAPAIATAILSSGVGAVHAAWRQRMERRTIMSLFSRHVSGEVAEAIWNDRETFLSGGTPKPQRLIATVLFSDIRGFTPLSESLSEEELMEWLNTYMAEMSDCVLSNNGVIDKYIGDAIMAVWGAPVPSSTEEERDNDARRAACAAMAMSDRLDALNARSREKGLPEIGARIGIHTGPLVAGTLGSQDRLEYTVIGDTVNVAARLESAASRILEDPAYCRATAIAVSAATKARMGLGFETYPLGELALKGKSGGTAAYSLVGAGRGNVKGT